MRIMQQLEFWVSVFFFLSSDFLRLILLAYFPSAQFPLSCSCLLCQSPWAKLSKSQIQGELSDHSIKGLIVWLQGSFYRRAELIDMSVENLLKLWFFFSLKPALRHSQVRIGFGMAMMFPYLCKKKRCYLGCACNI